jgi:SAM-dependent methyltransferase
MQTVRAYQQLAQQWAEGHDVEGFWRDQMDHFQQLLPPDSASILEIGVGGGRDAKELIRRGYTYTGIDVTEEFIKLAKQRLPQQATLLHGTLHNLRQYFARPFDGFWASASLLHVPKGRIAAELDDIRCSVRLGAIGFISLKEGEEEGVETDQLQGQEFSRFFARWQKEEFWHELIQSQFELVDYQRLPMSSKTIWHCFFVIAD